MDPESMRFEPLGPDDNQVLATDREFVPAVAEAHFAECALTGTAADLPLMQRIFENGPYTDDAVAEVVALGTALGDVIAHTLGMDWVRYSDDDGVDLALRYRNTSIVVFPRSMILKRLERDEEPDIPHLHDEVCSHVREMISSGEYR